MNQKKQITSLTNLYSTGSRIRQVKIENPTPFWIYINDSSDIPNENRNLFKVSPNSTFSSAPLDCISVSLVITGFKANASLATIVLSDTFDGQVGATPYQAIQTIGNYVDYPYYTGTNPSGSQINLPVINVEKFSTFYFLVNNPTGLIGEKVFSLSFGGRYYYIPSPGGVVSFSPLRVPSLINPTFSSNIGSAAAIADVTINVIKADNLLTSDDLNQQNSVFNHLDPGQTITSYYAVYPPYFIFSLLAYRNFATFTPNFTVRMQKAVSIRADLFNATYNTSITFPYSYLVQPKVYLVDMPAFIEFTKTNNSANDVDVEEKIYSPMI